jgi:hypothetical protein
MMKVQDTANKTVNIDSNLVWAANDNKISGYDWGIPAKSISEWHDALYDLAGVFVNPVLNGEHLLDPSSPYYGNYGRDNNIVNIHDAPITTAPTATPSFEDTKIFIYPNPTTDNIFIKSTSDIKYNVLISIYDNTGKLIYSTKKDELLKDNILEIDISSFPCGTYFLQLNNSKSITINKIIKQ